MLLNLKNILTVVAIATTLTLASCQSEPIEPKAAPAKKATVEPSLHTEDDDQPPKDGGKGGGN